MVRLYSTTQNQINFTYIRVCCSFAVKLCSPFLKRVKRF